MDAGLVSDMYQITVKQSCNKGQQVLILHTLLVWLYTVIMCNHIYDSHFNNVRSYLVDESTHLWFKYLIT